MKKIFQAFCCGVGGALIGFWAKSIDTVIGCLFFTLGVILLVGSILSICKEGNKEEKEIQLIESAKGKLCHMGSCHYREQR